MKKNYKTEILSEVTKLPEFKKIALTLTLYPKTKRLCDLDNVCSIQTKFLMDVLVTEGKLTDDTYIYVPEITFKIGSIDKTNPRCEAIIKEI